MILRLRNCFEESLSTYYRYLAACLAHDKMRHLCMLRKVPRSENGAPVAQLDRASGYEPEGREFESPRAHHFKSLRLIGLALLRPDPYFQIWEHLGAKPERI
jgi:hypothetical protein